MQEMAPMVPPPSSHAGEEATAEAETGGCAGGCGCDACAGDGGGGGTEPSRAWVEAEEIAAGRGAAAVARAEACAARLAAGVEARAAAWAAAHPREHRQGPRQLRGLYLFAGPARQDSLAAAFERRGWIIDQVDVLQGGDLMRARVYQELQRRARDGEFDLIIVASPCNTYSVARFRQDGASRPLRRRSAGGRVQGLWASERWAADEAEQLVERAAKLVSLVVAAGGDFIWENPIDRGDPALADLNVFSEPDHYPVWLEPVMVELRRSTGAEFLHMAQTRFADLPGRFR